MNEINPQEEVTLESMQALVEAKASELSKTLNKMVIPLLFEMNNEYIVGYAEELTRYQKSLAIGKMAKSAVAAGEELLNYCLIKNISDARFTSTDSKYDAMIFGAAMKMMDTINIISDLSKKK